MRREIINLIKNNQDFIQSFEDYDNTLKFADKKVALPITVKNKNADKIKEISIQLNRPISHIVDELIENYKVKVK